LGIVFADAFLRGMRDLGYKNPAWALAEAVDNSFQAGASTVVVRFGFDASNTTRIKPDFMAVCDNGNGMIPEMIGYAVRWGGTDRENDRSGFGRYGYGLPSSAVSLARRYSVYSKPSGGEWHVVTVDIDELAAASSDAEKTKQLLTAQPAKPPSWVLHGGNDADELEMDKLKSGTVIVFEDMDRLKKLSGWIKADTLRTKLLQHFGVIYRHWFPERKIYVDGVAAQAADPLFLMEHGRFFDETAVRAEKFKTKMAFEVETSRGTKGTVTITASVLPPNFQLTDPAQYGVLAKRSKPNKRWEIMRDYNGLLICREQRQIDCIQPKWTKFQTYDANIKIEIDFDPELDEFFGVTTSKQQIVIEDEMWERLMNSGKNHGGLSDLIKDMRARRDELEKELKAQAENNIGKDEPRPSSTAMQDTEKFKGSVTEPTPEQRAEGQRNLEAAAATQAAETGEPKDNVFQRLAEETEKRRWEVEFRAIPEGPFYRPVRLGDQKRLIINTDHPFFTKVYDMAPDVKSALEVLLYVLAERELEANEDAETFYQAERQRWSERLRHALNTLIPTDSMTSKASVVAEMMHEAPEAKSAAQA
jgi:hypothetical protein